jgi:hypothetical protein
MSNGARIAALAALATAMLSACGGGTSNGADGDDAADQAADEATDTGDDASGADADADGDDDGGAEGDAGDDGCVPTEETCNGLDDDCDGETDETGVTGCPEGQQCLGGSCRFGGLPNWGVILREGSIDPRGVTVDPEGRITLVGCYGSDVDFGGGTRTTYGAPVGFALGLDATMSYSWDVTFGQSPSAYRPCPEAVAMYPLDSRVVVVGGFSGATAFGTEVRTAPGNTDGFVATYAYDGTPYWDETFGAVSTATVKAVAVNDDGIYIAGTGQGALTVHGHALTLGLDDDVFVARLPLGGDAGGWAGHFGSAGYYDRAGGIAANPRTVVVGGAVAGPADFGGGLRAHGGLDDGFYVSLDAATGAWSADQVFGGAGYSLVHAVTMTLAGGFVAAGGFSGEADFGGRVRTSVDSDWDGFAVLLRRTGAWGSDEEFHAPVPPIGGHIDSMTSVAADAEGGYVVAGTLGGIPVVRRYDAANTLLWDWRMTPVDVPGWTADVIGVAFAPDGTIVLVGNVVGGLTFPTGGVGGDGAYVMRIRD